MGQQAGITQRDLLFTSHDGFKVPAYVAEPGGAPSAPRVVIAPEVFGLSPWIRGVARRLAREGFRAVAVEIFARDLPAPDATMQMRMAHMNRLSIPGAVADLRLGLDQLQGGPAASIGFCLGGALSLFTAAQGGLSACVDCYGRVRWGQGLSDLRPEHPIDAARRISCPVLGIYGKRDPGIPVADAEELRAVLPPRSELALYDAGHAFLNDTRPDMHVADQATLAWTKIVGFLRRTL